jgi:hypothetical protein
MLQVEQLARKALTFNAVSTVGEEGWLIFFA